MPDRDWPPGPRRLVRVLRSASYAFSAVAGLGVLTFRPGAADAGAGAGVWVTVMGSVALVAGLVALVGAAAHWWQVEWVALWPVAGAFAGYAVLDWMRAAMGTPSALAEAALLTATAALVVARGMDLMVFSLTLRAAREDRIRLWRARAEEPGTTL